MDWNSPALTPYRLRTVRIGVHVTLVTVAVLFVFRLLPGREVRQEGPYTALLVVALAGAILVAALPWPRLFERGLGIWAFYAWSCFDIVLITMAIALTGREESHLYLLYALTTVFFSASYPPKGQAVLTAASIGSYVAMIWLMGGSLSLAALFMRISVVALIMYITLFLSRELMAQMLAARAASSEARRRSELLNVVAKAGASATLEASESLNAIVDAVRALGFDTACINLFSADGSTFTPAYGRGLPPGFGLGLEYPTNQGMTALVREHGRTIVVDDYSSLAGALPPLKAASIAAAVASPIRCQGKLAGLLVGGTIERRQITPEEVEAFELLAVQTGYALENATLARDLQQREAWFRSLVQNASDVVCVADSLGRLSYITPSISRLLGYDVAQTAGADIFNVVHEEDRAAVQHLFRTLGGGAGASEQAELRLRHRDGSWRWVEAVFTNLQEEPSVGGMVVNFRDITERKAFEKQLRYQAFHDQLTGLPNRAQFMQRLGQAPAGQIAVLLLDLDSFKTVNDSLGHEMGDQLLIAVAERLRSCLRPDEMLARLGGDEFTILVENADPGGRATELAEHIQLALGTGIHLGSRVTVQTTSIGIALGRQSVRGGADLLRRADLAMYAAKERGKAGSMVFDALMSERARERLRLEGQLREAVREGQLFLEYQPLVSLTDGSIEGVEALVRWRHPYRGVVLPAEFVPLAEETGLILPIGRWVLGEACQQLRTWQDSPGASRSLYVSVNVSPRQFAQPGFCQQVRGSLAEFGCRPEGLQIEITESVLIENREQAMAALHELRETGVRVAIDDFGTGYSSLSYLREFPVDVLKVDRSFVESIESQGEARALVHAIIALARTLKLTTVAEGIERAEQIEALRALQCETGQGYFFSHPVSAEDATVLLGGRRQAA